MPEKPVSEQIEKLLTASSEPLSIDDIGKALFRTFGTRERNLVRVTLHRLDARGLLEKFAARYRVKRK